MGAEADKLTTRKGDAKGQSPSGQRASRTWHPGQRGECVPRPATVPAAHRGVPGLAARAPAVADPGAFPGWLRRSLAPSATPGPKQRTHFALPRPRAGEGQHHEILAAIQATQSQHVATLERLVATHEEARRFQEDETKVGEGSLGALRGDARWLVYLARGCDTFRVGLCPSLLGRDLFDGLRRAGDAARTLLTQAGFPVPINNRVAYGIAAGTWGGRDADHVKPYSLTAADFPRTTEEAFDTWYPPVDTKLEQRPPKPPTLADWRLQVTNEIRAWGLVYGEEHRRERELARDRLEQLHERDPHQYPFHWLTATWEELWWRWWEELKDILRLMQRELGTASLTKDILSRHALVSSGGGALGPPVDVPARRPPLLLL